MFFAYLLRELRRRARQAILIALGLALGIGLVITVTAASSGGAAERRARASDALGDVGLRDRLRHLPSELSGGQQQRVAIARALVKQPAVLLADEPTGNLDEETRDEIIGLLERLWQENELTLVLVTHDSPVARRAQRIAVMRNGKLSITQDTRRAPTTSAPAT